ncbi:MAG: right-handed parallel beta-helix repeat-containing protein [Flavobacteriales bacterium]|nr:right-handed parallel beta-helix repeat-containing protein [Flavobacteriales bacterium]
MANAKTVITLSALLGTWFPVAGQQMVDKYLWEFDTLGVGGHPNDAFNDHQAFVDAAAFFQARHGYGRLLLEDGEYIMGVQQLRNVNDPSPGPGWDDFRYPTGALSAPNCKSLVASQNGFLLDSCFNFTIQGGTNTSVRYRDCLYYGTFLRDSITGEVFSAVGVTDTIVLDTLQQDTIEVQRCMTCLDSLILPQWLNIPLRHAAVGTMFTFTYCDSVAVRNVELNGNIDAAILGGKAAFDGMQTAYDGVNLWASSRCLIENVHAHHFGRDGLMLAGDIYTDSVPFADAYPGLQVSTDPADNNDTIPANRTVLFNNEVLGSRFHWNGRQGFSWTALAGLTMSDCELNYNGAGRLSSSPGSGMDIEGIGGPMRVRHGTFNDCQYLHNQNGGVVSSDAACLGQQHFTFTNCIIKAGSSSIALWPTSRGMRFYGCQIYGQVEHLFEQAEDLPYDTTFNLMFHNTNFYEEDGQWSYLGDYADSTLWATTCMGGPHKVDMVGVERAACVNFDSCGFFTNCWGTVRLLGRSTTVPNLRYCPDCVYCGGPLEYTCPPGSCATSGPYLGTDTAQDARYVKVTDCIFRNTGRTRCTDLTQVLSIDLTTVDGLTIDIPTEVRGAIDTTDAYSYPFGEFIFAPTCYPYYCNWDTVIFTNYGNNFPPCLPFFTDTAATWVYCSAEDLPTTPCGELLLTKTATPDVAFIDSSVTFTITVCNNTVFATPLLLSEQLPPSFTVTGVSPAWSLADTSLTLDNGHCAVFEITGHFTAFGDFTNSVTLDPDTTATGDELSADADVSVVSTCAANIVIPDSALASVVGTVFSGTVNIQGLFFVDDDVLFQNAQVFMEAGAEIIVQNGSTLDI